MDKSASRPQAALQKQRPRVPAPDPPPETLPPSLLYHYLHLGATAALALVAAVLLGLLAAGKLRFGASAAASTPDETKEREKGKGDEKGGRYQIEVKEDLQAIIGHAGKLDYFGERLAEAQAFKYKGGFLEVWLEPETYGKSTRGDPVPQQWNKLMESEDSIRSGDAGAFVKEGTILVTAVRPVMPVAEALEPYHQHLGGLFVVGPAGGLHQITTVHIPASHWQIYRILVNAGPPEGKKGSSFNLWTGQVVNIRQPLVADNPMYEHPKLGGGTDLAPEAEVTLMERKRGSTMIRLKARFLSEEAVSKAAKK